MFSNIKIIMAVDEAGGFGKNGKLPWHFKEDMAFFKTHTMGKCCVMGRKTYDEINSIVGDRGKEKLLAGRVSWVLTRNPTTECESCYITKRHNLPRVRCHWR